MNSLVARLRAEVEYCMLAHTTAELFMAWVSSSWTMHLLLSPTLICDNLNIVHLSHNLILHARTKNVELTIHFVRELTSSKKFRFKSQTNLLNLLGLQYFGSVCQVQSWFITTLISYFFNQIRMRMNQRFIKIFTKSL